VVYLAAKRARLAPSTVEMRERAIAHLHKTFARKLLIDITPADVNAYKRKRLDGGASPRYVNMDLEVLRAILRRNSLWEQMRPEFALVRVEPFPSRALSEDEEETLLHGSALSISRQLYLALLLALSTGMRYGEIKHLRWSQVDLSAAYLTVGASKTKTGANRKIPLNERALTALMQWAEIFPSRASDQYVFPAEKYAIALPGQPVTIFAPYERTIQAQANGSQRVAAELDPAP
jgi:integrase